MGQKFSNRGPRFLRIKLGTFLVNQNIRLAVNLIIFPEIHVTDKGTRFRGKYGQVHGAQTHFTGKIRSPVKHTTFPQEPRD